VSPAAAASAVDALRAAGERAWVLGEVVAGSSDVEPHVRFV
jgi:hypothetical protein